MIFTIILITIVKMQMILNFEISFSFSILDIDPFLFCLYIDLLQ